MSLVFEQLALATCLDEIKGKMAGYAIPSVPVRDFLSDVLTSVTTTVESPTTTTNNVAVHVYYSNFTNLVHQAQVGVGPELIAFTEAVNQKNNISSQVSKADLAAVSNIIVNFNKNLKLCGGGKDFPSASELVDIVAVQVSSSNGQ